MAGRRIRDAVDARACLRMMSVSGLPRAVWARSQGIDGRSLNAWRLNLTRSRRIRDGDAAARGVGAGRTAESASIRRALR